MATLTYGDLRLLTRSTLEERGVDSFQWSGSDLKDALNEALKAMTRALGLTRVENGPLTHDAKGIIDLPALLTILYVRDYYTMRLLLKTSPEQEDRMNPSWRSTTGVPYAWMDHDGSRIRLNRIPSSTTYVSVGYIETPIQFTYSGVESTDDAQTVDTRIPLFLQEKLKLAAAAYLLRQAGDHMDMERSELLLKQFLMEIGADQGPAAKHTVER